MVRRQVFDRAVSSQFRRLHIELAGFEDAAHHPIAHSMRSDDSDSARNRRSWPGEK